LHVRHGRHGELLSHSRPAAAALALALALGALASPAFAYHDEQQHITEDTAYTLRHGDVRLGLWKLEYAPWEPFYFGSYQWPWLLSISNLHMKWRLWHDEDWAFAWGTGFYHFDTKNLKRVDHDTGNAQIDVAPLELTASYRFSPKYGLSLSSLFTSVRLKGQLTREALKGAGNGAVNNYQLVSAFEWRYTRVTAFVATARYLVFQRVTANADVELHPDAYTTVAIHYSGQSDAVDFRGAGSLELSAVMSWQTFNLRLGYGYGNYNVPGVNFVIGRKTFFPDFDMFWVF
jgi:hypothetical protein